MFLPFSTLKLEAMKRGDESPGDPSKRINRGRDDSDDDQDDRKPKALPPLHEGGQVEAKKETQEMREEEKEDPLPSSPSRVAGSHDSTPYEKRWAEMFQRLVAFKQVSQSQSSVASKFANLAMAA